MYDLPAITFEGKSDSLPCPPGDLIDLAFAIDEDRLSKRMASRENRVNRTREVLRTSPTLLLFLLHHYRRAQKAAKRTGLAVDFWGWLQTDFVNWLAHNRDGLTVSERVWNRKKLHRKRLRKALAEFANAADRKTVTGSLCEICKAIELRWGPKRLKRWLASICRKKTIEVVLGDLSRVSGSCKTEDLGAAWFEPKFKFTFSKLFQHVGRSQDLIGHYDVELQQEKLLAMKQLAYGASHEINNPLANIATRAQTLLADESHPERRNKLATIYEQAMRAHEMISDLMLFAHPAQAEFGPVDLIEVIEQVACELRPAFRKHDIHFGVKHYPGVTSVEADGTKLAVAIKALLQNSMESLVTRVAEGRRIQIRVWQVEETSIAIGIDDNGIGIERAIQKHMFDPFFSGREAGRGLGFGLSKAWTIIHRLHHGELKFVERKQGAEFQIRLPIAQPAQIAKEAPTADEAEEAADDAAEHRAA